MRAIAYSTAAVLVLVGLYLALGGASYAPAKVADPCATRSWRGPQGFEAIGEQIVLSALDVAACQLLVHTGLQRSIEDAQNAGALNATLAGVLRGVVGNLPIDELLNLLQRLRGL